MNAPQFVSKPKPGGRRDDPRVHVLDGALTACGLRPQMYQADIGPATCVRCLAWLRRDEGRKNNLSR